MSLKTNSAPHRVRILLLIATVLTIAAGCTGRPIAPAPPGPAGTLVIAGGGPLPDTIIEEAIRSAGGPSSRVVVIPHASRRMVAGPRNVKRFEELGCENVVALDLSVEADAIATLDAADLIWISGGSQNRLMQILSANVRRAIHRCYERGGVVGGTSAGAAVMSPAMITGKAELEQLWSQATDLNEGLGLLPDSIVDQHFHRRQRFNRLLSAVLDRPGSIGIGVDEETAAIVRGHVLEVIGNSSALILDARASTREPAEPGQSIGVRDVRLHVIRPGMHYPLPTAEEAN